MLPITHSLQYKAQFDSYFLSHTRPYDRANEFLHTKITVSILINSYVLTSVAFSSISTGVD